MTQSWFGCNHSITKNCAVKEAWYFQSVTSDCSQAFDCIIICVALLWMEEANWFFIKMNYYPKYFSVGYTVNLSQIYLVDLIILRTHSFIQRYQLYCLRYIHIMRKDRWPMAKFHWKHFCLLTVIIEYLYINSCFCIWKYVYIYIRLII